MKQLFDVLALLGGACLLGVIVYSVTNWQERRREFGHYRASQTPPGTPPPGDYRQFVQLWRRYRHDYANQPRNNSDSLGEYLRRREFENR